MSSLSTYLEGYPLALPEHLRGKLHNDWTGPLKKIPRSWNARGPRCGKAMPGYAVWPPKLVEGKGVARWESQRADSIVEIPDLALRTVRAADVYEKKWVAIERREGHPDCGQTGTIELAWVETAWDTINGGALAYSPSALQKFSPQGFLKLEPKYYSWWRILTRREEPGKVTGEDTVLFFRNGYRPDHVDVYYSVDLIIPVGQIGLHWE